MAVVDGVDISRWQVRTPPLDNLAFAFARATYGLSTDPKYAEHASNIRAAGIVLGAYHFGYNRSVGAIDEQAAKFLAVAGNADLLALDLEGSASPMSNAEAATFVAAVQARGRSIGLYHSLAGFPQLGQDWDWIAAWDETTFPHGATFWQYQGSPLDRDRFNGTLAELHLLASGLPDSSTGDDVNTVITVLPFGGTFVIPISVVAFEFDPVTGVIGARKTLTPADHPLVNYDATVVTTATRGDPFLRIADGTYEGWLVASASVTETPNTGPDCTTEVAAARASQREADRVAVLAAVGKALP